MRDDIENQNEEQQNGQPAEQASSENAAPAELKQDSDTAGEVGN